MLPLAGWNKFVSEVRIVFTGTDLPMIDFLHYFRKIYTYNIQFQAYFMGCAFDSFSTSWSDRSYVFTLLVLAWLIPLISNIVFYICMIHRVQTSNFQYYVSKQTKPDCYNMFNVDNKVSDISFNPISHGFLAFSHFFA